MAPGTRPCRPAARHRDADRDRPASSHQFPSALAAGGYPAAGATSDGDLMFGPDPLLPDGAVLVHIGPFKTGTTSLQTAFDSVAAILSADHGIWWASPDRR